MERPTIPALIGRRIRRLREAAGRSQDEVADAARHAGLDWTRGSVAALETGRRGLSAEELLVLPVALAILTGQDRRLEDLLSTAEVEAPGDMKALVRSLRRLLAGESVAEAGLTPRETPTQDVASEAVKHAAQRLRIDSQTVSRVAREMWGRSFSNERDARVAERLGAEPSTAERVAPDTGGGVAIAIGSLRALRGHVTRELIYELRQVLGEEDEDE